MPIIRKDIEDKILLMSDNVRLLDEAEFLLCNGIEQGNDLCIGTGKYIYNEKAVNNFCNEQTCVEDFLCKFFYCDGVIILKKTIYDRIVNENYCYNNIQYLWYFIFRVSLYRSWKISFVNNIFVCNGEVDAIALAEYKIYIGKQYGVQLSRTIKYPFLYKKCDTSNYDLNIVILSKNINLLKRCLEYLYKNTVNNGITNRIMVCVVWGGTVEQIKPLYNSSLRVLPAVGMFNHSQYNNTVIRAINGSDVVLLNDDVCVCERWIENLLFCGYENEDKIVGMKLYYPEIQYDNIDLDYMDIKNKRKLQHVWIGKSLTGSYYNVGKNQYSSSEFIVNVNSKVEMVTFACVFISAGVFNKIGLLDESLPHYHNDVEFCLRARKNNIPIYYASDAVGFHDEGGTFRMDPLNTAEEHSKSCDKVNQLYRR